MISSKHAEYFASAAKQWKNSTAVDVESACHTAEPRQIFTKPCNIYIGAKVSFCVSVTKYTTQNPKRTRILSMTQHALRLKTFRMKENN
jgi:hypothetical protein